MNSTKKLILITSISLFLLIAVVALFDGKFVYHERKLDSLSKEGIILDDRSIATDFISALNNSKIPYTLDTTNGNYNLTWDSKYSLQVNSIKQNVLNIVPKNKKEICFEDEDARGRLVEKLKNASIKFELRRDNDDLRCVDWALEDDDKVMKIDSMIKEIRQLEESRRNNK